jgi:hypothetical protein
VNGIRITFGRYFDHSFLPLKHTDDRLGFGTILGQSVFDRVGRVILTRYQQAATRVADPLRLRRAEVNVEVLPTLFAEPPAENSFRHDFLANGQQDDRVDIVAFEEEASLRPGSRESIEHEAMIPVVQIESHPNNILDGVVRYKSSAGHAVLNAGGQLGLIGQMPTKDFAHRYVGKIKRLRQQFRLRPFAASLRPHDDVLAHSHLLPAGRRTYRDGQDSFLAAMGPGKNSQTGVLLVADQSNPGLLIREKFAFHSKWPDLAAHRKG